MKRRPSAFLSVPPSPRTPSVTSIPRTLAGQTIPVGWNCTISMSIRSAPAFSASATASPVPSHELEVIFQHLPMPPVAERARDARAVREQAVDGAFHEDVDALVDRVLLEGAEHFEARAVAHVD